MSRFSPVVIEQMKSTLAGVERELSLRELGFASPVFGTRACALVPDPDEQVANLKKAAATLREHIRACGALH